MSVGEGEIFFGINSAAEPLRRAATTSSVNIRTTAAANVDGESASNNSTPSRTGKPSAPTVVDTIGFSMAIAS